MLRPARWLSLVFLLGTAASASGNSGDELSVEVEARIVRTAERELAHIERLLRAQPGITAAVVANITLPLQSAIEEDLGRGPVRLQPRAIYRVCLERAHEGASAAVIGRELVELHRRGALSLKSPATSGDAPRQVASAVLEAERLEGPMPRLPAGLKLAPGTRRRARYQLCVGTDGRITSASAIEGLPSADVQVIAHLRATWRYRPQPVQVCTTRAFSFSRD